MRFWRNILFSLFVLVPLMQSVDVQAANYQSQWQGQSDYLDLVSGQREQVWVEIANTGSSTWYKYGDNAVHLGTSESLDRESVFYDANTWLTPNRIEMVQDSIAPGETARFAFKIKAPMNGGHYKEYFRPVVEGVTWMNNQGIYWQWNVTGVTNFEDMCMSKDEANAQNACTVPEPWMYDSAWSGQSDYVTLAPGEAAEVFIKYENTGSATWYKNGDFATHLGTANPLDRSSDFQDSGWLSGNRLVMDQNSVKPGEEARFMFRIKAPDRPGKYYEHFRPVVENVSWLKDQGVFLLFEVIEGTSNNEVNQPVNNNEVNDNKGNNNVVSDEAVVVSSENGIDIYSGDQQSWLGSVSGGTDIYVDFAGWVYTVQAGGSVYESSDYVQLVAKNNGILTVKSYDDVKSWNSSLNDNMFRDTIEVRYSGHTDQVWVINELSLEDYLAGVAESSNSSPDEYLKTIAIAERTYAIYHLNRGGRHPENYVDLYNSVGDNGDDQVYRGYGFEVRNPNVVSAVRATEGKVVTYDGEVVVTPYFSQSDGRTRDWQEVWGGSGYPWCVSVEDPYNEGKELLGHGVGMSASGARYFADEEDKNYDWILRYYYTGIDVGEYNTNDMRMRVGIYHV